MQHKNNMNYKKPNTEKRYYSIGEVAEMFSVTKSLLRYWETEFNYLKPYKNSKGERRFTQSNLDQLSIIYHLVKERGFTLDGAKKEIEGNKEQIAKKLFYLNKLKHVKKMLTDIQSDL